MEWMVQQYCDKLNMCPCFWYFLHSEHWHIRIGRGDGK